jgi:hypothetical protein
MVRPLEARAAAVAGGGAAKTGALTSGGLSFCLRRHAEHRTAPGALDVYAATYRRGPGLMCGFASSFTCM